ncbi:MAG: hypothetical protein KGR19_10845, partial [Acidobacteria bacterium]|nr:hypothetical protein [Acidobacteriota bacterium]
LTYTFTFSEEITGLTSADFSNTSTATGCTFTPASSTGTVITVTASGCSSGGVAIRLASGSITDVAGNAGPASAYTGSVVRNGARQQPQFKINSLGATPFTMRTDAFTYAGDDSGGMAISDQRVFLTGDGGMGRFNLSDLGSPGTVSGTTDNSWADGIASDLRARKAYTFDGPSYGSGTGVSGTITGLTQLDPATGAQTSTKIILSQPITLTGGARGVFSGYGRVVIWSAVDNRVYDIEMPSGIVDDLGARPLTSGRAVSEAPGQTSWGTAEYFDGQLYLDYVESSTRIARMKVSDGTVTWLASGFAGLSDMANFTVDPSTNRWYFHFEHSAASFPGNPSGEEAIGYSVASFTTGPSATWGSAPSSPTNASSLTFPITFSDSVSGIASGDFTNAGTATGCTFTPSAASGTSINVVASGCSEGTVQVRLAADSVVDSNGSTGPSPAADSGSVTVDRTAPSVSWGSAPSSPTNASSLTFPITFGESVSGIASGDFSNAGTATGCTFTPSAASGTTVNVVVTGCSEGTVQVQLASGSVTDAAGNGGPASAASSGTVTVDRTAPTASWTSPPTSPTNATSISFTISFSEMVTGLTSGDFTNSGTATGCTFAPGASSGTLIAVVVSGCSDGTLIPVLQAGAITDLGGNAGPGVPVASSAVTVDRTPPTAAFTSVPTSPTRA